jgi:hypothetical protein
MRYSQLSRSRGRMLKKDHSAISFVPTLEQHKPCLEDQSQV